MFNHDSLPSRIFRYGCLAPSTESERVREQMRLAHRYRNDLVRAELDRRQACESCLSQLAPDLAPLAERAAELAEQLQALRDEASARHAVDRNRQAGKASAATIHAVKKQLQEARQQLRLARKEAWQRPDVQAGLAEIEAEHRQRRLQLRSECRVFWGSYLICEQSLAKIRAGAPPRFKRWDGSGHLAVQIQGGMTWDEALSCRDSRFRIEIKPGATVRQDGKRAAFRQLPIPGSKRSQRRVECVAWLRIGSEGRKPVFAQVPFVLHRAPPPGCRIKWVHLLRERVGIGERWSLSIVVSREEGFPRPDQAPAGSVGIDMGWRLVPALSPPPPGWDKGKEKWRDLRVAFLVGDDDATGELRIPAEQLERCQKVDEIQKIRDQNFNAVRQRLTAWLLITHDQGQLPDWLAGETEHLHAWHNPERLTALLWGCPRRDDDPPDEPPPGWRFRRFSGDEKMYAKLEKWRKRERHLHAYQDGLRARLQAWRKWHYEQFVVMLRRRYHVAFVEDINWMKLAHDPQPEEENKNVRAWYRRLASPGQLRRLLGEHMAEVCPQDHRWTTQRCHVCLEKEEFDTEREIEHECSHCGALWDQDENAARLLLLLGKGDAEPLRECGSA
jgi:hypothetical protein